VTLRDGVEECVEGAQVTLSHEGQVVARAVTDAFGEYRLRGLPAVAQDYEISIEKMGYESTRSQHVLNMSRTLLPASTLNLPADKYISQSNLEAAVRADMITMKGI